MSKKCRVRKRSSLQESPSNNPGYPGLSSDFVFQALLGHGMFAQLLPPCFSSVKLLKYVQKEKDNNNWGQAHSHVNYYSTRNANVSRQIAIPHPESYLALCNKIKDNWQKINKHIGKPCIKFNFCHVRKINGKEYIFDMNYEGKEKWKKEDDRQNYCLGCTYVVQADISNCFPSIYSHSIPWAIQGKNKAKKNNNHWSDKIDKAVRNCKDGETNGLSIGPHTSNIISEIILTKIDCNLQAKGFKKVIRHIDDYVYFAKDEEDAIKFVKLLELHLKEYELILNQKKTKITSLAQYFADEWPQRLGRFNFHQRNEIGFTAINSYISLAISIANETGSQASIKYAVKVVSKKELSIRAKKLYVKKMLSLVLIYPYLLSILEEHVFCFSENIADELPDFIRLLFDQAKRTGSTDALAFCFYYAVKYNLQVAFPKRWQEDVIKCKDCVAILLAWKYTIRIREKTDPFDRFYKGLYKSSDRREYDQFWLFMYEYAESEDKIPECQKFLREIKEENVSFLNFDDLTFPRLEPPAMYV